MKKKIIGIFVCMLLILTVVPMIITADKISGNTIYVDDDGNVDYTRIQDAIDNASDGDIIFVYSGIYYENVVVDKSITLHGEDRNETIIDGNGDTRNPGVSIVNDYVNVSDFTVQHGCWIGLCIYSNYTNIFENIFCNNGIGLGTILGNHNIISHNQIENNSIGLSIDSSYNTVEKNIFTHNTWFALGIHQNCNIIKRNHIFNNAEGIVLSFGSENKITYNSINNNEHNGLYFRVGGQNLIKHNNFIDNGVNAGYENAIFVELFSKILMIFDLQSDIDFKIMGKNVWENNFWDDWNGIGPYLIPGKIILVPWFNFDWHPAKEPYEL